MKTMMTVKEARDQGVLAEIMEMQGLDVSAYADEDELEVEMAPGLVRHWIRSLSEAVRDARNLHPGPDMMQGTNVTCRCGLNNWVLQYFCPELDPKMAELEGGPADLVAVRCRECGSYMGFEVDPACVGACIVKDRLLR